MNSAIDHISLEGVGWIRSAPNVTSFGWSQLPSNVHLSVSHVIDDLYVNLHVTKNTGSQSDKPKIEIIRISKALLDELLPFLANQLLSHSLEPFDLQACRKRKKGSQQSYFLSLGQLQKAKEYHIFKGGVKRVFQKHSKIEKKKKLRIQAGIVTGLTEISASAKLYTILLGNIRRIPRRFSKPDGQGYLITKDTCRVLVRIQHKWYAINGTVDPLEILRSCMEENLVKHLLFKTKMAIGRVRNAAGYDEVKQNNASITLYKNQHNFL